MRKQRGWVGMRQKIIVIFHQNMCPRRVTSYRLCPFAIKVLFSLWCIVDVLLLKLYLCIIPTNKYGYPSHHIWLISHCFGHYNRGMCGIWSKPARFHSSYQTRPIIIIIIRVPTYLPTCRSSWRLKFIISNRWLRGVHSDSGRALLQYYPAEVCTSHLWFV